MQQFLTGATSHIYSYTIILVILVMMLAISLRLLFSRRKKGYLSMTFSLLLLIVHYLLLTRLEIVAPGTVQSNYIVMVLKIVSYIFINFGIFQLYNPTKGKHFFATVCFLAITFLISLTHIYLPSVMSGVQDQVDLWRNIGLELYLFLLIFLSLYLIAPFVGQTLKFQISVTIYFCSQIGHLMNVYMFQSQQQILTFLEYFLPVGFYFMMFLILFERVLELMHAMYNSSVTDGLTRLYNRKYFYNRVNQYVSRKIPVSIIFSDIDNFKKLNDTKGHHMGDEVLKQVANIMQQESEELGIAGRYGGEEMVVLVIDETADVEELAEKIRARVEKETIVTVSLGCSKLKGEVTSDQLIKQADEAMYLAKTTGKNKVVKFGGRSKKSLSVQT